MLINGSNVQYGSFMHIVTFKITCMKDLLTDVLSRGKYLWHSEVCLSWIQVVQGIHPANTEINGDAEKSGTMVDFEIN